MVSSLLLSFTAPRPPPTVGSSFSGARLDYQQNYPFVINFMGSSFDDVGEKNLLKELNQTPREGVTTSSWKWNKTIKKL